jgi:hypothetical protein
MTKFKNALNSRIARKLGLYFILTSSLITILTSWVQIKAEYNNEYQEVLNELKEIENTHIYIITQKLWSMDLNDLAIIINGALSFPYIEFIAG